MTDTRFFWTHAAPAVGWSVLEFLFNYGALIWVVWVVWLKWFRNPRPRVNTAAAKAILTNSDFRWNDVLRARGGEFHIDHRGYVAILSPHHEPRVIDHRDVVEFGFDPLLSRTGRHIGWRFHVTTDDHDNPISWVDMDGTNLAEARMWQAKLNAVFNYPRVRSNHGTLVTA